MAKYWIRGFFGLVMTAVVTGAAVFVAVHGIDRQAEITRFQIETEAQICRDAWEVQNEPMHVTIKMESDSGYGAAAMRRLPPPPEMPEEYPEPVIVMPREWDGSPSPWPGEPAPQRKSPYVEWLERQQVPPSVTPEAPKPYTPGSTDPARREEFRPQARPRIPLHPGKVAQL